MFFKNSMSVITTACTEAPDTPRGAKKKRSEVVPHDIAIPEMTLLEAGLQIEKELGTGNQSSVHLASKLMDGSFTGMLIEGNTCIKRFDKADCTPSSLTFLKEEFWATREFGSHPCITDAYQIFQDDSFFYIELPLFQGGDFIKLKQNATNSGACCDDNWWMTVFKQAMQGLAHLHEHGFMHCDVKEPNLMLKTDNYQEPEVVLIDLGIVQPANVKRSAIFGTPGYIPPEVWDTKVWTPQGDAFSLGVVVLQMMIDKVPDSDRPRCGIFTENTETFKDIRDATQTRDPQVSSMVGCGVRLQELATQLLIKDPAQRPNVAEALWWITFM
jgi:serine/threonine protein kinase